MHVPYKPKPSNELVVIIKHMLQSLNNSHISLLMITIDEASQSIFHLIISIINVCCMSLGRCPLWGTNEPIRWWFSPFIQEINGPPLSFIPLSPVDVNENQQLNFTCCNKNDLTSHRHYNPLILSTTLAVIGSCHSCEKLWMSGWLVISI